MERLVTGKQMKALDAYTIKTMGVPSLVLMERAALALCEAMEREGYLKGKLLFLCGSGNNGADGVAAARILHLRGYETEVWICGNPEHFTQEMKKQIDLAEKYGISFVKTFRCSEYTTIIDALLGVGLSRRVEGVYQEAIEKINSSGCKVVSADLPSGICADTGRVLGTAVKADMTVTFAYKKAGLCLGEGAKYAGKIVTAEIGIVKGDFPLEGTELFACEKKDLKKLKRAPDGNKGTFGKVFLIAGSKDIFGAAYLSALAAMKAGAGMVKICTRIENKPLFSSFPEAMLAVYDDQTDLQAMVKEGLAWADAAAVGPGLGLGAQAEVLLDLVLEEARCPLVLDADALNLLKPRKEKVRKYQGQAVLTPHLGELARLMESQVSAFYENPFRAAEEAAAEYGAVLVCKDARTIVSKGGRCFLNLSGNDGMATAGSGDVLTGTIASLLARGIPAEEAAYLGVYLHGLGGDLAAKAYGRAGMLAGNILEGISQVLQEQERKEEES